MKENLKRKIDGLYALLSEEQKSKEILEIKNILENTKIITYLKSIGDFEIFFKNNHPKLPGRIQMREGVTYLWCRKSNGTWIVKLGEISQLDI